MCRMIRIAIAAALAIGLITAGVLFVGNQPNPAPLPSTSPLPSASGEATGAPVTSSSPTPSVAPSPAVSALSLSKAARNRVDKAITAAHTPTGISQGEQNFLLQRVDDIALSLDSGDLSGAAVPL